MKQIILASLLAAFALAQTSWPANVTAMGSEKGKLTTLSGKLEAGVPLEDLSWAANSSVACFPATQFSKYQGHHVFFATQLPSRSIMTIKLVPKDPNQNLSLYAYSIGATSTTLPPKISSVVSCESDEKWDRPKAGKTQDHTRSVKLNAIQNPYNVVIGVSGPKEAVAGEFDIQITLE